MNAFHVPVKQECDNVKLEALEEPKDSSMQTRKTNVILKRKQTSLDNICRVCLKSGKIPIFGSKKYKNLHRVLITFAAIQVDKNDNLPKYLCVSCYYFLKNAVTFRNTAHKSEKILQKKIAKSISCLPQNEYKMIDKDEMMSSQSSPSHSIKDEEDELYETNIAQSNSIRTEKKWSHCKRCNVKFDTYESACNHYKSDEHKNLKVECSLCKRSYNATYIKVHMLRHRLDPTKAFICEICGRSFPMASSLKCHKAIHQNEFAFKCNICPYKGRYKESLKMHMRSHTGEKPYACSQCSVRFSCKMNLNRHLLRHDLKRNHICDMCEKGFYIKSDLNNHIKAVHCGLKEHICDICNKAFGYRRKMMRHQLKVHKREKLSKGPRPSYLQAEEKKMMEAMHREDHIM